jgi:hypothetical protein
MDRFDDYDVRQAAYWSLLAGACGHTYGNNNVWSARQGSQSNQVFPAKWATDLGIASA